MNGKQLVQGITSQAEILKLLYGDLMHPSAKIIGETLGNVLEFSCLSILPLKLLTEKVKLNFNRRLEEYRIKLEQIPEEKRCEVHPQIGVPIIERLSYTTNDDIADLFTTLLAKASNKDTSDKAHPSFIHIIDNLSVDEARIIRFLAGKDDIEYCTYRAYIKDGKGFKTLFPVYKTLIRKYVKLENADAEELYLSNLISAGILQDMSGQYHIDDTGYKEINEFYMYKELHANLVPLEYKSIDINKSYFKITALGRLFISACVK